MHVSLAPEALFSLGSVTVTNTMLTTAISSVLLIVALVWAARKVTVKPADGFAGLYEAIISAVLAQAEQTFGSRELALKYFPLLATLFIFILLGNTLGLLPGFNTLELGGAPVFRSVTTDLNTTVALAIVSVVLTQIYAIRKLRGGQSPPLLFGQPARERARPPRNLPRTDALNFVFFPIVW